MSAVLESADMQRTAVLESLAKGLEEEIEAPSSARRLDELVLDCSALAAKWRAICARYSNEMAANAPLDYEQIGDILRPIAQRTIDIYAHVQELSGGSVPADLTLAAVEIRNIAKWLATWPVDHPERRAAARREIAMLTEHADRT